MQMKITYMSWDDHANNRIELNPIAMDSLTRRDTTCAANRVLVKFVTIFLSNYSEIVACQDNSHFYSHLRRGLLFNGMNISRLSYGLTESAIWMSMNYC